MMLNIRIKSWMFGYEFNYINVDQTDMSQRCNKIFKHVNNDINFN